MKQNAQAAAALNDPGGRDTRILNTGKSLIALPQETRDFAPIVVQQLLRAAKARNV